MKKRISLLTLPEILSARDTLRSCVPALPILALMALVFVFTACNGGNDPSPSDPVLVLRS